MCRIVKTCRIGDIIAKLDRGFTKDGTGDADRTHVIDATMLLNGEAWRVRVCAWRRGGHEAPQRARVRQEDRKGGLRGTDHISEKERNFKLPSVRSRTRCKQISHLVV